MEKTKIILDCDPGHDDAVAIMLAGKSPAIDLLGITVVAGNQTLEKTVRNALNVTAWLDIDVPVRRKYVGKAKLSARPEQLFFSEKGMPGTVLFSTFLGDFIEYEVELDDGQMLIINEYTKDTTAVHELGERVHIRFDATRISLYDDAEEVLSK